MEENMIRGAILAMHVENDTKTIFYEWKDNFTFDSNIEQISYYIKLIIGGKEK